MPTPPSRQPPTPDEEAAILRSVADRVEKGLLAVPPNLLLRTIQAETGKTLREPDASAVEKARDFDQQVNSPADIAEALRRLAAHVERQGRKSGS